MSFILSEYIEAALGDAEYEKLDDDSYSGRIPSCKGVVAFGSTLRQCENELRATLEDWILVGLRIGHLMPELSGINLNEEITCEPVETLQTKGIHS